MPFPMPRAGARRSSARVDALRSVRKVLQPLPVARSCNRSTWAPRARQGRLGEELNIS